MDRIENHSKSLESGSAQQENSFVTEHNRNCPDLSLVFAVGISNRSLNDFSIGEDEFLNGSSLYTVLVTIVLSVPDWKFLGLIR